jgi:hypothetical protein
VSGEINLIEIIKGLVCGNRIGVLDDCHRQGPAFWMKALLFIEIHSFLLLNGLQEAYHVRVKT